jgi:hypothetical protein
MNEDSPATTDTDKKRKCRPKSPPGACNPSSAIDDRRCRDKGIAAQLAYTQEQGPKLDDAQKRYDQARKDYRVKRHDAALQVQDMKHDVKYLIEQIKCRIEQERVVRCLDDAFVEVCEQLDCCEGSGGCCTSEFEFDAELPNEGENGDRKLAHRIERYKAEIAKASACFDLLATEPAELDKRVAALKSDIAAIKDAQHAGDAATLDLKTEYAKTLVAKRKLARIWSGFADTNAYVECLCQTLATWSKGVDIVAGLVCAQAVRVCQIESDQTWCATLIGGPVAEILAVYDRLCGSDKPWGGTDQPEQPDDDHSEDCGCGNHKRDYHGEEPPAEQVQSV